MERRTQPGYEYHSCDFMDDGVYIDMNLLQEYEDTGLTPEQIQKLKNRDTEKEAHKKVRHRGGFETHRCPDCGAVYQSDNRYTITDRYCPTCGKLLDSAFRGFCANCGQRIKKEI
ncbi:hypothetical protein EUBC25_04770 [Claveliimonas bilis]|uniref:hypothetical protein n=1 Tax=Claveliimonas bilis TaxID=3028070 RepID=UPI001E4A0C09|nr:hypothetical protein [Claveliimonas bilis]BCZ26390.1 hypothetical protein EUBC25_04770 [Claveliimonas bilis]